MAISAASHRFGYYASVRLPPGRLGLAGWPEPFPEALDEGVAAAYLQVGQVPVRQPACDRLRQPVLAEAPNDQRPVTLCYQKSSRAVDRIVDRESVARCAPGAFRGRCAAICAGSAPGAVSPGFS